MRKYIFNKAKHLLPKISKTEMIALQSGTVSLDREIMSGYVEQSNFIKLSNKEHPYLLHNVNDICESLQHEKIFDGKINQKVLDTLNHHKAFSYIIKEKYDGLELPVETQSRILVKLTSINPALGVTVMVPNSLGPGELLQHYGTDTQKEKYLPKLSSGEYIPCFGLTGPQNGSDAGGNGLDVGIVKQLNGKRFIEVDLNKRYITLAPIANIMGVAINVIDPEGLLTSGTEGITVALLEKSKYPDLDNSNYHNPLNVGFPNGTLKGLIRIDIEDVIGGPENTGHGWKMLMECLAAGRGICLPATANASAKTCTYGIFNYIKHRKYYKTRCCIFKYC